MAHKACWSCPSFTSSVVFKEHHAKAPGYSLLHICLHNAIPHVCSLRTSFLKSAFGEAVSLSCSKSKQGEEKRGRGDQVQWTERVFGEKQQTSYYHQLERFTTDLQLLEGRRADRYPCETVEDMTGEAHDVHVTHSLYQGLFGKPPHHPFLTMQHDVEALGLGCRFEQFSQHLGRPGSIPRDAGNVKAACAFDAYDSVANAAILDACFEAAGLPLRMPTAEWQQQQQQQQQQYQQQLEK
eukprot:406025-Pelagomonas_calceolata.AAC.8